MLPNVSFLHWDHTHQVKGNRFPNTGAPPTDFGGIASGGPLLGGPASYPHLRTPRPGKPRPLPGTGGGNPGFVLRLRRLPGHSLVGSEPAGRRTAPAGYCHLSEYDQTCRRRT